MAVSSIVKKLAQLLPGGWGALPLSWNDDLDDVPLRVSSSHHPIPADRVKAIATMEQKRAAVRAALEEGELSGLFEGDAFASVRAELGLPR